jgi:hypothetical protein
MKLDDINDVREWAEKMDTAICEAFKRNTLSPAVEDALRQVETSLDTLTTALDNEPIETVCDACGCTELITEADAYKCDCGNVVCENHWEGEMCSDCKEAKAEERSMAAEHRRLINEEVAATRW